MTGFELRKLVVSGDEVDDAEVGFSGGLNVVVGPSETGKSYIFKCLEYMLGGARPPKKIPQDEGYSKVALTIVSAVGEEYELTRALRGGSFTVSGGGRTDVTLSPKHSATKENISTFLLRLVGMDGKKVRKNASGVTRSLSFRDLAHLAFVDEGAVMVDRSPALTGQNARETEESRVFHLLISGEDDSSVVPAEKPELFRAQSKGRAQILETLIGKAQAARDDRRPTSSLEAAEERLAESETAAKAASEVLSAREKDAGLVEDRRRDAWSELRTRQSKRDVLRELQTRFSLLQHQYEADLERLAAIAEAALRVEQMPVENCPVCGARPEHQEHDHGAEAMTAEAVRDSCAVERAKISSLISDLAETASKNAEDLATLSAEVSDREAMLESLDLGMREMLRPKVVVASQALRDAQNRVRIDAEAVRAVRYEDELRSLLEEKPKKPEQPTFGLAGVSAAAASGFAASVEDLLRQWDFPGVSRVSFSEKDQDITIGDRARQSYGQGKLALTHAAFTLGLLRSCIDADRPGLPLVMIDSPLVVYREPDQGEEVPAAVKDRFYRSIRDSFGDTQVVIFENEAPPPDVERSNNVIVFTGSDEGRYGFL
jgi:hypothetical protein